MTGLVQGGATGAAVGALMVAACAAVAGRLRWLTLGGAVAAWAVGTSTLLGGGIQWAATLLVFFLTGTGLTRAGRLRKTQPEHRVGGRTAAQVLGTGGAAAAISLVWGAHLLPDRLHVLLPAAFVGSLATATADTWATEIGMLNRRPPRLITTGRPVAPGTSGGVTWLGSAAGAAGTLVVAAVGSWGEWRILAAAVIAGTLGMLGDSILGATIQAIYCRPDGSQTEEPGSGRRLVRGLAWLTNPVVNLIATTAGALVAMVLARGLAIWW